jgi:MFS family permease
MSQQPPQWPPAPQQPQQPPPPRPSSGRLVASILAGGFLGMVVGAFIPALVQGLTGAEGAGAAAWLVVAMFVTMPIGGLLGALWGMRRGRRGQRPPRPPEEWRRRPNRIVDVHRRDRGEG